MVSAIDNLVKQTSTTVGTGNFTLSAATGGFQTFNGAFGNGATTDVFYYFISHASATEWEVGTGHMSSSTVLVRDTVLKSSNSNNAVNFSTGTKTVVCDVPSASQVISAGSASFAALHSQPSDSGTNTPYAMVIDKSCTNLVTNPSFETNTTGWAASGANASIARITSDFYSGAACLEVTVTPAAIAQGAVSSAIAVSPSTRYMVSAWVKAVSGTAQVRVVLTGDNSGATNGGYVLPSSGWSRVLLAKTTNGSDTNLTVSFVTDSATTFVIRVDGVMLEATTATYPSAYVEGSRIGGFHYYEPYLQAMTEKPWTVDKNGRVGPMKFQSTENLSWPWDWEFEGSKVTSNHTGVTPSGIMKVHNTGNGLALRVTSDMTTGSPFLAFSEYTMLVEAPSATTANILGIAAPSDKYSFTGKYLDFLDKSGKSDWSWDKNKFVTGAPAENLSKYFKMYGGGSYATTTTAKTGTVAWSGTALTGTGTAFTTEFSIGDVIVVSGQTGIIATITNNTTATTQAAASPAISAGASIAKQDAQYSPPMTFQEATESDHKIAQKAGLLYGKFFCNAGHLRLRDPAVVTPGQTITTTNASASFTTSTNIAALAAGDWVYATGMSPRQVYSYSGTSGQFRTAADATLAGIAVRYRKSDTVAIPASQTDGLPYNVKFYRDVTKSIGSTTAETSIFTTTPIIKGGAIDVDRTLVIRSYGTMSGTGTLVVAVKYGATTICTNTTGEVLAAAGSWDLEVRIRANSSLTSQRNLLRFNLRSDANNATLDSILMATTSTADMAKDAALDITFDSTSATGIATEVYGIDCYWE